MTSAGRQFRMVGIGELLWDLLPEGRQLGGSPMNVVHHCQANGIKSYVVSSVGLDPLGKDIIKEVQNSANSTEYIQLNENKPTGTVSVILNDGIPDFTIHNEVAWDYIQWDKSLVELAGTIDAVAFGSLAQRNPVSRNTIQSFIDNMKFDSIKVFDINLRQNYYSKDIIFASLTMATILKINDEEFPVLSNFLNLEGAVPDQIKKLMDLFKLKMVAFTKGSEGSIIYTPDQTSKREAPSVRIKDTVGAGDSFTAMLISGLLMGKNLDDIHTEASETAAWVCTQKGGTPSYPSKA